jgi:transcriptional regulator with XRE-family HTH domain
MSNETRGHGIKARRLALGIKSLREFAEASGISREALTAIEKGAGTAASMERAEAWLDRIEAETGHDEPAADPIRFTFHDIHSGTYSIGEMIVEGPVGHPDELVAAVAKMLAEFRTKG